MRIRNLILTAIFASVLVAPVRSQELVVCDDVQDPLTLDPHKQFSEKNHTLVQQIYEGLVRFDPNGKVEPALAESWQRMDPLRTRFRLRKGVAFHNGEPFNAQAVKFSVDRYLNPATGFPAIGFISSLAGAEVVDDYTVDILTHFPDGLLMNRLAGFILIVPPDYVRKNGDTILLTTPNGTGPFQFQRWEKGRRITLSANPHYWMQGFPKVEKLIFVFLPASDQMQALISGKVDLVTDLPGTMTIRVLEESENTRIIKKSSFYTYAPSLKVSQGSPLSDIRVRKAMNHAIDKTEMIRYDAQNNGIPLATLSMPGEIGHNPSLKPYPFDLKKAKELMKEAGYEDGFPLKVFVKEQGSRVFGILREQLEHIRIILVGEVVPDKDMIQTISQKQWDLLVANCPDPMAHSYFIQAIALYSKSPFSIYRDKIYDDKLEKMTIELDPEAQGKLGQELDKYIYDNALSLFTYQKVRTYGARRTLYFTPSVTAMLHFHGAYFGKPSEKRAIQIP